MTTSTEFTERVNAALAKYELLNADLRYAELVRLAVELNAELVHRSREIIRLRAASSSKPKDNTELVSALRTSLAEVLSLLDPPEST